MAGRLQGDEEPLVLLLLRDRRVYHHHRSWIDDTTFPISTIGTYIGRLEAGEDIARPSAAVLTERERITGDLALLADEQRIVFDQSLALARTVFPYVENHNFYIDHRYLTIFWNKVREFGPACRARLSRRRRGRLHAAARRGPHRARGPPLAWSSGVAPACGPSHWPAIVERRKSIYDSMRGGAPRPAGESPRRSPSRSPSCSGGSPRARPRVAFVGGRPLDAVDRNVGVAGSRRRTPACSSMRTARMNYRGARSWSRPPPPRAGRPSSARSPAPCSTSAE